MTPGLLKSTALTLLGAMTASAAACRAYDRYAISLRDADTQAPIEGATITTRYDLVEALMGLWSWHPPKRSKTKTNAQGAATANVEPGLRWWFEMELPKQPMQWVNFNADGTLNHSLGTFETNEQWIRTRYFMPSGTGSMELAITRVGSDDDTR
jgi:hypothetical protein